MPDTMRPWIRYVALAGMVTIGAATATHAASITYSDTFDPSPDVLFVKDGGTCVGDSTTSLVTGFGANGGCNTLSYSQTLTAFNAATDTLTSGFLTLTFYDDGDTNEETFDLTLDASVFQNNGVIASGSTAAGASDAVFNVSAYIDPSTGALTAILLGRGNQGLPNDFYFDRSVLTGLGTRTTSGSGLDPLEPPAPVPVPEPASILLLGTGLIAAARLGRRRP